MEYYKCSARLCGTPYAFSFYDLKTHNHEEIKQSLTNKGYEVLEIYDIKKQ